MVWKSTNFIPEQVGRNLDEKDKKLFIKNIESIIINFKNGKSLPFLLKSNNIFHTFKIKNDLCIVQSEYDIKYYENLFI